MLIAAFSVSPYASTYYRVGQKPFNPLLGETYECIREDRGWRFIAEQVSHHPPISACYCDSKNFIFSQGLYMWVGWGREVCSWIQIPVLPTSHRNGIRIEIRICKCK